MNKETFFNHKRYFYLKVFFLLYIFCLIFFCIESSVNSKTFSSIINQILGVISFVAYCYLLYFGLVKRKYKSFKKPIKETLSIHIWLGVFLIFIVPLHSGFSNLGNNLHSYSYYMLVIVVLTGIWGCINYSRMSSDLSTYDSSLTELINQIEILNIDIKKELTDKTEKFHKLKNNFDLNLEYSFLKLFLKRNLSILDTQSAASAVLDLEPEERNQAMKVISRIGKKRELQIMLQEKIKNNGWLKIWLYFHVPASFVGLILILLHVFYILIY